MINKLLNELGFNDKEIEVYVTVLKFGKIAYGDLAKNINVNRTTLYGLAKGLIKKGVVHEDIGGTHKYLVATEPDDLLRLFEKEQKEIDKKKEIASKAIKELSKITLSANFSIPRIRFIEENKLERFLFEQTASWNNSAKKYDGLWWGFQDKTFVGHYKKWMAGYWNDQTSKKMGARVLTNASLVEEEIQKQGHENRLTKYWNSEEFSGTLWIAGDYIIMVATADHPHYLVETHDPILSKNLREVFRQLWKKV